MHPRALFISLIVAIFASCGIMAQNFTWVDPGFPVIHYPITEWADIDNDGDLDAFMSGLDENLLAQAYIFRNDGTSFTSLSTTITGLYSGSCAFGDYNNDGLADLLVCGTNGSTKHTILYRNDGGGSFSDIGAGLTAVSEGDVAWADINNDGWMDIIISGESNLDETTCILYTNNAGSSFTNANAGITGHIKGELAWSDIDLDGDMDLAINGKDETQSPSTKIFINTEGNFSQMGAGLTGLSNATIAWGDFNNDTWPDLLISGADVNDEPTTLVYKNNSGSSFSAISGPFNGIVNGSAIWGDFDNDGDLDFLIGGSQLLSNTGGPPIPENPAALKVYHNQGNDQFLMQNIHLAGVQNNAIVYGDYDNDSDLDLLVCGDFVNPIGIVYENVVIYRNETGFINNPPQAPAGLNFVLDGNDINITWNPATDDKTPSAGLNYNLRIGTGASNMDIMSALADLPNGYRRIVASGNTGGNISWNIHGLDFGEYFASVQAIDPSYEGSEFSESLSIELPPSATFTMADFGCINEGVMITYTGNGSSSAQYNWDFDSGTANPGIGQGPHTVFWDTHGIKTVSLSVTENGVTSNPVYLDINIIEPPSANAGEDQTIPQASATQLSGSAAGGSGSYSYYWMPDSLLVNPAQPNPTTIPLLETIQFILEVTDAESGCTDEDYMIVYVSGGPLGLSVSAEPDTICEGDSTQLMALASGGSVNYAYWWTSNPPGFTSNDTNPVAYPSVTTTYYVELSDGLETLTDSVQVTVWPLPAAAGSISGPEDVCIGSEQVLYQIDPVPGAIEYFWELSEGMVGGSISNSIEINFPAFVENASITVTAGNECGIGQSSTLEINTITIPDMPGIPTGQDSLCTTTDTLTQYQITEPVPWASSYEWELLPEEAGTIDGEGMSAEVHWVKNWTGQTFVSVRAVNDCGLSDWSEALEVYVFSCLGIDDPDGNRIPILVYPNPANRMLNVECWVLNEYQDIDLVISDLYGRKVIETSHPGRGVVEINTSDIQAGTYILSMHARNGLKVTKRVVIQH